MYSNKLKCVGYRNTYQSGEKAGQLLKDKNGNAYAVAKFVPFDGDDTMVFTGRQGSSRVIFNHDGLNGLAMGKKVFGEVVRFDTSAPYEIISEDAGGNKRVTQATHISVVVFDGENAISIANNQLRDYGVTVMDEDGNVTERTTKAPVTAGGEGITDPE